MWLPEDEDVGNRTEQHETGQNECIEGVSEERKRLD
jgi:hypothetical protein